MYWQVSIIVLNDLREVCTHRSLTRGITHKAGFVLCLLSNLFFCKAPAIGLVSSYKVSAIKIPIFQFIISYIVSLLKDLVGK